MSKRIKVMSVFGTRPEAIKMAPLVLELQKHPEIESIVCITAQHREMLDSVMDCFGIRADYDLNIMQQGQDLTAITTRVLERMREVLGEVQPDIVLVHGDTTTTFAGALAAFYAKIPVGHVEAGLRTYDRWSPFPEEMNRSLVGRIATLHFAPTANNAHNLEREAVEGDIFVTGNTVIDAMAYTVRGEQFVSDELRQVDFSRRVIAMTCHRRENYGQPMRNIFTAVRRLALNYPDVEIVFLGHHRVTLVGFHTLRNHRLIGYQQQRPGRNVIRKARSKQRSRLHIHGHCAGLEQILLEVVVMLPDTAVGRIHRTGPIIPRVVTDGRRNRTLQHKCRQGRHLRRIIIVRSTLTTDGRNRQNQIPDLILLADTPTFTQEQTSLRMHRTQQVHDNRRIGTTHSEINDGNSLGMCRNHIGITAQNRNVKTFGKYLHIVIKIGQQNIFTEIL